MHRISSKLPPNWNSIFYNECQDESRMNQPVSVFIYVKFNKGRCYPLIL